MIRQKTIEIIRTTGLIALGLVFLIISGPRSWSLYPLGLTLITGLLLWIIDFKSTWNYLIRRWYLILPPVVYFLIHFMSIIGQGGSLKLLEPRLMFILVPVFGLPVFVELQSREYLLKFIQAFYYGILFIIFFLFFRMVIVFFIEYQWDNSFTSNLTNQSANFFSVHYSIFEHPTYFALKILWVILSYNILCNYIKVRRSVTLTLMVLFSGTLILLASKAGIILITVFVIYIIIKGAKTTLYRISLLLIVPVFLIIMFLAVKNIKRINEFTDRIEIGISRDTINWREIDQRTKEWYSALQIIKEEPVTGVGLVNAESRMVEEYTKNNWDVEALYRYNAHNQFLEAQMTFGLAGLFSLLWMLITPVVFRKKFLYPKLSSAFVLLTTCFLMIESMFNRQWGIMFFILFYCLIVTSYPDQMAYNDDLLVKQADDISLSG